MPLRRLSNYYGPRSGKKSHTISTPLPTLGTPSKAAKLLGLVEDEEPSTSTPKPGRRQRRLTMASERAPEPAEESGYVSDSASLFVNPSPLHGMRRGLSAMNLSEDLDDTVDDAMDSPASAPSNVLYAGTVWETSVKKENSPPTAPEASTAHTPRRQNLTFTSSPRRLYTSTPHKLRRKSHFPLKRNNDNMAPSSSSNIVNVVGPDGSPAKVDMASSSSSNIVNVVGPDGNTAKFDMDKCDFVDVKDAGAAKTVKFATGKRTAVDIADWELPYRHLRAIVPSLSTPEATQLIHKINNITVDNDKKKEGMDDTVEKLKASHKSFVNEFEAMKQGFVNVDDFVTERKMGKQHFGIATCAGHHHHDKTPHSDDFVEKKMEKRHLTCAGHHHHDKTPTSDNDDEDDRASINSSNYAGSDAVIETATALPIQRFTQADIKRIGFTQASLNADIASGAIQKVRLIKPGEVKLIDIPPRKSSRNPPPDAVLKEIGKYMVPNPSNFPIVNNAIDATPPASPSKEAPKTMHPRHHCVVYGHVYRELEFKNLPSPLRKEVGGTGGGSGSAAEKKIKCEVCGHRVEKAVWQCEVPVCMQEVCGECAGREEVGRAERAVGSWL